MFCQQLFFVLAFFAAIDYVGLKNMRPELHGDNIHIPAAAIVSVVVAAVYVFDLEFEAFRCHFFVSLFVRLSFNLY
jgi:hypothetical protein